MYYMFGFLFLVFIILVITCSEATILLCYFHLCAEVNATTINQPTKFSTIFSYIRVWTHTSQFIVFIYSNIYNNSVDFGSTMLIIRTELLRVIPGIVLSSAASLRLRG